MKEKDIVIGAIYTHQDKPTVRYLGIGQKHIGGMSSPVRNKKLLVIESTDERNLFMVTVSSKDNPQFWDGFVLTKEKSTVYSASL